MYVSVYFSISDGLVIFSWLETWARMLHIKSMSTKVLCIQNIWYLIEPYLFVLRL